MNLVTPMRAADLEGDISKIKFPAYISPKLDGYRATVQIVNDHGDACLLSKNNKPIRNIYTQEYFGGDELLGLDGELIVGLATDDPLQRTSSGVTAAAGKPSVTFWVFDDFTDPREVFRSRLGRLKNRLKVLRHPNVRVVPQQLVRTPLELLEWEEKWLAAGYEGVMVRSPDGLYKQGGAEPRATLAEGYCSKLKRREDAEAVVVGVTEQTENTNTATKDELGRTKRSSHKAGKVGKSMLGSVQVLGLKGRWEGVPFDIGVGWTDEQRAELWQIRRTLPGCVVKFRHGKTPKTFKAPQFPVFADWKDKDDL